VRRRFSVCVTSNGMSERARSDRAAATRFFGLTHNALRASNARSQIGSGFVRAQNVRLGKKLFAENSPSRSMTAIGALRREKSLERYRIDMMQSDRGDDVDAPSASATGWGPIETRRFRWVPVRERLT